MIGTVSQPQVEQVDLLVLGDQLGLVDCVELLVGDLPFPDGLQVDDALLLGGAEGDDLLVGVFLLPVEVAVVQELLLQHQQLFLKLLVIRNQQVEFVLVLLPDFVLRFIVR